MHRVCLHVIEPASYHPQCTHTDMHCISHSSTIVNPLVTCNTLLSPQEFLVNLRCLDDVYRKHLEALLAKEQLDTAERDSMIEAALAEQNAKRDAELAARMAARMQLQAEVTRGQLDQIQQHQQAR